MSGVSETRGSVSAAGPTVFEATVLLLVTGRLPAELATRCALGEDLVSILVGLSGGLNFIKKKDGIKKERLFAVANRKKRVNREK